MKILKKISILATALLSLALISCKTDSSETSGSSEPNPTLPGTKGGKDNEKDIFKGLTFYDSSKKEQAEYGYTKYTFSENGTVAITYTKKDDEKEKTYEEAIINYSLSEDGKIVYKSDAIITPESDLTLYAVYEEIKAPNDDGTDKTGEQDKQDKKTVNVTGIMVSIPLLALLAAGTVYLVGKIKKS